MVRHSSVLDGTESWETWQEVHNTVVIVMINKQISRRFVVIQTMRNSSFLLTDIVEFVDFVA